MVEDRLVATVVLAVVTASFPFYLWGAWIVIDEEVRTWGVMVRHLSVVGVGLLLTTVPVATWMVPRLLRRLGGYAAFHAFAGVQAYAFLAFALTGIVPILRVKRRHDLYADPDPDVPLEELHEDVPVWWRRLRVGVAGFVVLWLVAWVVGVARYYQLYV